MSNAMLPIHNFVTEQRSHYISYNFGDRGIYGCDTTAIVIGQMQRFYILKGDHRKQLDDLKDFDSCIQYWLANPDQQHPFSNKYSKEDAEKVIKEYEEFQNRCLKEKER